MPNSHSFNIFHKFNRKQRYNWSDQATQTEPIGDTAVPQSGTGQTQGDYTLKMYGDNKTDVTYRARVYLMIRALATEPSLVGKFNSNISPSYDISLRGYHTHFA